jgi:hypothetical protein
MAYEIVKQIGNTIFCLTYDTDKNIIAIKRYIDSNDEAAGATYIEKRLMNKTLEKVTPRAPEFIYIKKTLKTINVADLQREAANPHFFNELERALDDILLEFMTWLDGAEDRRAEEQRIKDEEAQEELEELISEGHEIIDEMKQPMLCIAWLIDWLTAGERTNILYCFLAYASQVILKNPISVIGIGEGGSGKTHIQDVALSLLPQEYIMTIKSTTDAALYGYCDTNPYIFDGKIVNIGDMGGKNNHEESQNFKDAMKELQSDGYMARVKREAGADGKWENKVYELFGKPCLTYTNVPGFEFEDQEKSRSIFYQPRVDNDEAVAKFKQLSRMKGTPTEEILNEWKAKIPDIQKMVIALRARLEYVHIYNPYDDFMRKYLGQSKYFKRDVDKYDGILRVITAINGYRRPLVNNTLLTTKQDIEVFIDILERYHDSITSNLAPGAADLLQELKDHDNDWDLYETGITINDYMYKSVSNLHKTTLRRYFSELNTEGYLKVIAKEGQSNVYALQTAGDSTIKSKIELSESDKKVIDFNYGDEAYTILSSYISPLDIYEQQPTKPFWNDFLPEDKK